MVFAYTNFENKELIDTPGIWEDLKFGDQLSLIIGFIFTFIVALLPLLTIYLARLQHHSIYMLAWYQFKLRRSWGSLLLEIKKGEQSPLMHYPFIVVAKRCLFVVILMSLYQDDFMGIQLQLLLPLSVAYQMYLISNKPHDKWS
jgi:hypothetical protein